MSGKKPVAVSGPRKGRQTTERIARLETIVRDLRNVAEAAGLHVRQERLLREAGYTIRSGLCRVAENQMLILDSELPPEIRVDMLLGALAGRDLSGIEMPEEILHLLRPESPSAASR